MTSRVHPSQSSETPDLLIVALDELVEHEYNDEQRTAPLARRLQAEGLLKNPPIVTQLDDEPRYVVLDGANRTTALHALGYGACLVQAVRYEEPFVTLSTWHHVVTGLSLDDYLGAIHAIDGLEMAPIYLL